MKGVDASYHYEGYDVYKAALRSERPRQKPGRENDHMPFWQGRVCGLAVLHSREVFIWRSPGYHYFIRSDTAWPTKK